MAGCVYLFGALIVAGTSAGRAQTPPTPTTGAGPALRLRATQRATTRADGGAAVAVELVYGAESAVQVRLLEDGALLLFDGFTGVDGGTIVRTYPRDCGVHHDYALYSVLNGQAGRSIVASVVLCPEGITPTAPTPAAESRPAPAATLLPQPTAAVAAPAAPVPPTPAAAAGGAPSAAVKPGQPPVPPPPLEPPSAALTRGFVLAQPDDLEVASAVAAGVPLVKLLAIWLRGNDSGGAGNGQYQYVAIANLGGSTQDLSGWALQGDSGTVTGLTYYFQDGFTLSPGDSCRIYVGHPAEATCTGGSFALFPFWSDHGVAGLWDSSGQQVDVLAY